MSDSPDEARWVPLVTCTSQAEAIAIGSFLAENGVRWQDVGSADRVWGGAAMGPAVPTILVDERDLETARALLAEARDAASADDDGDVRCPACSEPNPPSFAVCWQCNASLEGAVAVDGDANVDDRSDASADGPMVPWPEFAVALLIVWAPSAARWIHGAPQPVAWFLADNLAAMVSDVGEIALIVLLARRAGAFAMLGLNRPRAIDAPWTLLAFVAIVIGATVVPTLPPGVGLGQSSVPGRMSVYDTAGLAGILLPGFLLLSAFTEELIFRGFLMTWLARKTGSMFIGVVVSSLLFAVAHHYPLNDLADVFVTGLILGAIFCVRRSLIPVTIAHFAFNLLVTLPDYGR